MSIGLHLGFSPSYYQTSTRAVPLRVAEIQGHTMNQVRFSAGMTNKAERIPLLIICTQRDLSLIYNNWYTLSGGETDNTNTYTILSASLQCPNGTVIPLYFSGSRSRTLTLGENHVQTDKIIPSQAGYAGSFPAGTYYLKHIVTVPNAGEKVPTFDGATANDGPAGSQSGWYNPANTTIVNGTDTAGVYTATGTALTFAVYFTKPIAIGTPVIDGASYIGVGDSIGQGTGDLTGKSIGGVGIIQRAAYNNGVTPLPMINITHPASQATLLINGTKWRSYIKYAKYAIDEYGTNDITSGADITALQTRFDTLWGILKSNGIQKIIKTNMIARTSSTDSWITGANQSPILMWQTGELRYQLENYWAAKLADSTIQATVDMAALRDGTLTQVWAANGATNYYTIDGLHPNTAGSIVAGAAIRAQMWLT